MKTRIPGWLVVAAGLLLLAALAAPSQSAEKAEKQVAAISAHKQPLVWPLPPDPPRVRWVQQFLTFNDVELKKEKKSSWFERMAGAKEEKEKEKKLVRPYGIAVDSRERIFVADWTIGGMAVFDVGQKKVDVWSSTSQAPLLLPIGVAVDANDRVFVSDAKGRSITCFSPEGAVQAQFGREQLQRPSGLAIDRERKLLYVADAKANRISVFSTENFSLVRHIGKRSTQAREPGKFHTPTNVAVDRRGNLYVADSFNFRVQIFNPRGRFVRAFGEHGDSPGFFALPKGIAVDSEGHIYVADAMFNNIQIFDSEGRTLLFVGSRGGESGQFSLLAGMYIDQHDRIYTTEQGGGRVQIFQYLSHPDPVKGKEVRVAKTE